MSPSCPEDRRSAKGDDEVATGLGCLPGVRPLFISGVYRSGTTFLTALINAHPAFSTSSSSVKFLRFCAGRYGDLGVAENRQRLLVETLRRIQTRWSLDFDIAAVERRMAQGKPSYALAYDSIMRELLPDAREPGCEWAEKLAVQWDCIEDFLQMFPDGKVVHIFRDPRDVCASYKAMTVEPWPTHLDAAFNSLHAMQHLARLREKLPPERLHVVRVEDLARTPRETVAEICRFLEVDFSDAMLDPEHYQPIAGEDWRTNTSFDGQRRGFSVAPRWPEHLTRGETIFVEMITQPFMRRHGYAGSGYAPTAADMDEIASFLADPFLCERFRQYLIDGQGAIGYRTDPYLTEMRIVFPERFSRPDASA